MNVFLGKPVIISLISGLAAIFFTQPKFECDKTQA
jgi:hypothetical protein